MNFRAFLVAATLLGAPALAHADLKLPAPSLHARVEQDVGLTTFSVDYSSPGVKKRVVFGDVVPYEKAWRAGANLPTKLTADRDFTFGGTKVKAGTYTIFVIPSKASAWTVALNSDLEASQEDYDAKKNVAQVSVKPIALPVARERLAYFIVDADDNGAKLDLEWDRVRLRVALGVETKAQVETAMTAELGGIWRPHFVAANYLLETDPARARKYVEQSIAYQSTWRNEWLRARILMKLDPRTNKAEALAAVGRAEALGKGDDAFQKFIKPQIAKATASWK